MISYHDIDQARQQAEMDIKKADEAIRDAAKLIAGRLRTSKVLPYLLKELKHELKNYNSRTEKWTNK